MRIDLNKKQSLAWEKLNDSSTSHILYGGGAGGGKSYLGCLWIITNCINYPETRWVIARNVLKRLKETTLNTFFDTANQLGLADKFIYNDQKSTIKWTNGSEILLKDIDYAPSDPNFDSLGSLEITGAFVDEVAEVHYRAIEVLYSRIRYKLKKYHLKPKIFMSCNPSKNWSYTEYYLPWKDNTLEDYKCFIQALPTDNPYLDGEYILSLDKLSPALKARLLHGEWEFGEQDAMFEVDDFKKVFHREVHNTGDNMFITIDVARLGNDSTVVTLWSGLDCFEIHRYEKQTLNVTIDKINQLKEKYNVPTKNIIVDSTGVGAGVVDGLKATEFIAGGKSPSGGYYNMKTECFFKLSEMFKEHKIKIISQDQEITTKLMQELEVLKIKDKVDGKLYMTSKDEVKRLIGRSPDFADAVMMRMLPLVKSRSTFDTPRVPKRVPFREGMMYF